MNLPRWFPIVDPVIFCTFFGFIAINICKPVITFQLTCQHSYAQYNSSIQCFNLRGKPEIEAAVHKTASNWNTILLVCYLAPSILSVLLLGAHGDKAGRKYGILFGLVGMQLMVLSMLIVNDLQLPLWILALCSVLVGLTGYIGIILASCNAYLSDIIIDKGSLGTRMIVLHISNTVAGLFGSAIVVLSRTIGLSYVLVIAQGLLLFGFGWSMLFAKQVPPLKHRDLVKIADTVGSNGQINQKVKQIYQKEEANLIKNQQRSQESLVKMVSELFKDCLKVISHERPQNKRTYLLLCLPSFLTHVMSEVATQGVITLYGFHSPFFWKPPMIGYFNICNCLANLLGLMISVLVFRKMLHLRNTTLALISTFSGFLRMLLLGIGLNNYILFAANAVGLFSNLIFPAIKGLAASLVEPQEVGKVFTIQMLTIEIGVLIGTFVCNSIYSATVAILPGAVFYFICATLAVSFVPLIYIHVGMRKVEDEYALNIKGQESTKDLNVQDDEDEPDQICIRL